MTLALPSFRTLSAACPPIAAGVVALVLAVGVSPARAAREPLPVEIGDSFSGNYLAALVAGADRDTVAAASFFREALRSDPRNPELIERSFVAAVSNGNMADAFPLAERLVVRDPSNGLAHLVLGVKAMKARQFATARGQLAKGGTSAQRDITATLLSAWAYAGSGESKRATDTLDKLRDNSFVAFREFHSALIADLAGNKAEALRRMKLAYDADHTTLRVVEAYSRLLSRSGDAAGAKKVLDTYSDTVQPHHPLIQDALASLAAGKVLEPLVRTVDEGAAEVLFGLGAAGGRQGDELAAMIYLRLSLFLRPQNGLATMFLADIYDRLKQNERAIEVYDSVPLTSPLHENAAIQMALTLDTMGQTDAAIDKMTAILAQSPNDVEALTALGNLQRAKKRYADASDTYSKALARFAPGDKGAWGLLYFRGISYERQKKWPLAEADFRKALELVPEQPVVLNYLGYSWIDQGMNLDEGFKMLRRAVALRPDDGYIVDSLGWAHYRLGEYDDAVKELERAIDLKPSDPTINDHLGDAFWKVGRKLEAHFQWNHARDLNPDPDDLPKLLAKIDRGLDDPAPPTAAEAPPAPATEAAPKSGG